MRPDFPWQIWAVGWLAVVKAVLWMSTDPVVPSPLAELLTAKFLILMTPFLLMGIGVWNLRRWAAWGLLIAAAVDIGFIGVAHYLPHPYWSSLVGGRYWAITLILLILNGPIGSLLILLTTPVLLKNTGNYELIRPDLK